VSATVSEAGSMTPTERELYAPETSKSIADVQRRQAAFEQQAAEQPLRTLVDPIFRLERTMGSAARERIIKGLEQGGRPVRDERGMTVGVVTKTGLFGGEVYTGRPDYDPIRARVEDATSGQFQMGTAAPSPPSPAPSVSVAPQQPIPGVVPTAPPRRTRAAPPAARGMGQRPAANVQRRTILGPASTTVSLLQ